MKNKLIMSSYQKFAKDIGLIGSINFLAALKGIIFLPLITKNLGAESYGIWVQFVITINLITPLVKLGLTNSLVRFLAAEKDQRKIQEGIYSTLMVVFGASLIVSLILLALSGPFSIFFHLPSISILFLAATIIFDCLITLLLSAFQAFQKMHIYSFFMASFILGEIGSVGAALLLGFGLMGAIVALLIIRLLIFCILLGFTIKKVGIKMPDFSSIKKYLSFGLPTLLSNMSYWAITSADKYLVGIFIGILAVGRYSPSYSLGSVISFFILPLSFVLFPAISKLYDEMQIEKVKIYLKYSTKYFLFIAIPGVFGLSILSRQLLNIFSTNDIAQNAYFVTPFVALSILFYGICDIFGEIFVLHKKTKLAARIWGFAALLNIASNFILIPILGIKGAAIATLFSYAFALLVLWYFSFKEFKFGIDWIAIIKSIFASILMASLISLLNPAGLLKTMISIILGVITYGIFLLAFRAINKKEISFFREIFSGFPKNIIKSTS